MTRPRNAAVLKPGREGVPQVFGRWPARWRTVVQVRCSASCCASAVRVWSEPRPWLSGRGRPEACMSACWRCAVSLVGERRLGQTAERSRSRAGVRSGSWVGLVHGVALTRMGTATETAVAVGAPVGVAAVQPRAARNRTEPTGAELSGDLVWRVAGAAPGQVELIRQVVASASPGQGTSFTMTVQPCGVVGWAVR